MLSGVLFAFLLLSSMPGFTPTPTPVDHPDRPGDKTSAVSGSEFCVLCYFTNWAQYRPPPGSFLPKHIDPTICTHIMYAFANISADTLSMTTFEWNDEDLYTQVMRHKTTNPNLKVLIAIGGATLNSNTFPTIVNSSTNRETFSRNAVTFLRRYQFDGLDVDWEFPGENYKIQFTAFLAAIRLEFDNESIATGNPRLLLTAAVSAYKTEMDRSYEVDKIHVYLDYISVMGYDYYGTWSQTLGHNSPLYVPEADKNSNESSLLSQNASMTYWLAGGTPPQKLILGMSTYARTFRMLNLAPNESTPGIEQTRPGSPYDTGKGGDPAYPGGIEGVLTYYQVCGLLSTFTRVWMEDSQVPYAYGPRNDHWEWIGYDDVQSMAVKAKYIIHHDLGGAMFWSLDNDDFLNQCSSGSFPLTKEVSRILNLKNTTTPAPDVTPLPRSEFCVLCYFTNWAQYRPELNSFLPEHIDPTICTHIMYAFAGISVDTLSMTTFEWNDEDLYARVMKHKMTNPNLKVLIAIGGATLNSNTFPTIVNSSTNRETFARNAVTFLRRYQFDGLDVDWEFPGENYKTQFTAFLSAIRSEFDKDANTSGKPRLLLTAAVSAYKSEMERSYEVDKIHLYLDYISIMGYDYYGTWSQTLGHNSPLYVPEADRNSSESSLLSQNSSVTYWLAGGTPPKKLVLGMSTYARTFRMLDLAPNKTTPGINQTRPGSPYDTGKGGDPAYPGGIEGVLTYYQVCVLLRAFTRVWMEDSQVPYAYGPRNGHWEWIAYDDVQSMAAKANYIVQYGLGGAMFWSLDNDDFQNLCWNGSYPLITEVSRILKVKNSTLLPPVTSVTPLPGSELCILCYFTNWAQYRPQLNSFLPEHIDPTICTHIMYAFAGISVDTLSMTTFEWNDEDLYARVMKHKTTNPNLKVLIAIGGATLNSNVFPTIVTSSTNRETFARNAVTFLRRYQFDGLDVDWEFPGENYKTQFTAFLSAIRSEFDHEAATTGKTRLLLTAAVSAYKSEMERSYEVDKIHVYLDYISVMGYDYYGTWSQTLGHNSPLYVPEADRNSNESSLLSQNASVTYWLAGGTPKEKLVLGMSTYARTFRMLDLASNETTPGNNQTRPGSPYDTGKGGDPAYPEGIEGVLTYYQVCGLLSTFTRVWMEDSQVPYAYGPRNGHWEWIAYDDVHSMVAKANYIIQHGLGGAMFWSLDNDDFRNLCSGGSFPLITEVRRVFTSKNSTAPPPPTTPGTPPPTAVTSTAPAVTPSTTAVTLLPGSEFCFLCYFTNWAQYRPQLNSFLPEHIDPTICTHIMYAFAGISVDTLSMTTFERNDEDLYARVMKHKTTNPNLKVLIAIGGATLNSNVFPTIVTSNTNRETFARNAVTFLRRYQFDGLDVDWEFPGENYKTQFTAFLSAIRSEFDHEAATTGKTRLLLTAAVSAYKSEMERSYEVDKIHVYLDYISVMGYDYYGTWSQTLGHNSPLYVPEADRNSNESSLLSQNASVTYWLAGGTPPKKLVLGMSTYARTFRMLDLASNETTPGNNQTRPGSPYDTGKGGDPAYPEGIEGVLTYYQVCGLLSTFTRVWMEDSQVPYAFGPRNGHWEWIGYDDVQSMAAKANYIIQHGLGGAMFWSLDNDDFINLCSGGSFPLITEVSRIFTSKTTTTTTTKPTTKIESLSTTVAYDPTSIKITGTSGVEGMYLKNGLELNIVAFIIFIYLLG